MRVQLILAFSVSLLAVTVSAFAGGGWIKTAGTLYVKVGATFLNTNEFHAPDGRTVKTSGFSTQAIQVYGEYGIVDNLSAVFDIPLLKRSKFVTAEAAAGFGDVGLEIKYGILRGNFPLAIGIGFEFPTGNERLFARNLSNSNVISYQPTGDGEFNTWLRGYVSHSFYPTPAFVSFDAGYNFRTQGLTNQYQVGLQGGYKIFEKLGLIGNLKRLATAGTANKELIYNAIGVGEGIEYTSYGFGITYAIFPNVGISADLASAFGQVKNIYSGVNFGFGIGVDL